MLRKLSLAAVAAVALGAAALTPTQASAWGGWHPGWHGGGYHTGWHGGWLTAAINQTGIIDREALAITAGVSFWP